MKKKIDKRMRVNEVIIKFEDSFYEKTPDEQKKAFFRVVNDAFMRMQA